MNSIENTASDTLLIDSTLKELEFYTILKFVAKYTYSELGHDYILKSYPNENLDYLRTEHSLIEEMIKVLNSDDTMPLDGISNIKSKLHKALIENAVLNPIEILNIKDSIRVFRLVRNYFQSRAEKYPTLTDETSRLHENRLLEKHISDAITETGEIADNATRELASIRKKIEVTSGRLRARLKTILRKIVDDDIAQEDFYTMREGRFVLPVKAENKRSLQGIIHGLSQTGATVYIEPAEIIEMNNELSILLNEEIREINRILSDLTKEIADEARLFLGSVDIFSRLDGIYAKGRYALDFGGVKPNIINENYIRLNKIRHPLLVHTKSIKSVVPLSIEFSNQHRGHLISGPNAGGKTVALKSMGLNILMALSGIFPLGDCTTNYRRVYSAIGDNQSIENNLSTFSSQMLRLKNILDNCSSDVLVLVDEIGSGTDPQEGSALAAGILDTFVERLVFFIATTHQSSLKTYALNRPEISNASLQFDDVKLQPTYHFLSGIPGNSYAFSLAENIGLSSLVLNRARNYLGDRQSELENSIALLQKFKTENEKLNIELNLEKSKYNKLSSELEEKLSQLKSKRQNYIHEAELEAKEILHNANALIEKTIKDIREQSKPIPEIKKEYATVKEQIDKKADLINKSKSPNTNEILTFAIGDNVTMNESTSVGSIVAYDNDNKTAVVDFNGLKFKVAFSELQKTAKPIEEKKKASSDYIKFDANSKIDLRGKRAEESLKELEDFISDAIMANIPRLTVVHGKGTGALRHAIHEYLSFHQSIESYNLGELIEGGAGVTIVNLR